MRVTLAACGPLGPCTISKDTASPSTRHWRKPYLKDFRRACAVPNGNINKRVRFRGPTLGVIDPGARRGCKSAGPLGVASYDEDTPVAEQRGGGKVASRVEPLSRFYKGAFL